MRGNQSLRVVTVFLTLVASLVVGAGAAAASAEHFVFTEEWAGSSEFAAGEGPCVSYAGVLYEDRQLFAKGVMPSDGDGEMVIVAWVDATFSVSPHDASDGPTYTGTYREKAGGIFLVTEDGDEPRVGRYAVHATAEGSDGSVLKFVLSGRITVRADGTVITQHEGLHCIRS